MSAYGAMFQLLGGQPGYLATTVLNILLVALFLGIAGTWLPLLLITRPSTREEEGAAPPHEDGPSLLALWTLAVGGGLIVTVTLGTASAFLFKGLLPGLAMAAIVGLVTTAVLAMRLRGDRPPLGIRGWVLATITVVPLCIGFWQHVVTAFPHVSEQDQGRVFCDVHRDSGFHVFLASIVREAGLPLLDLNGSPTNEYAAVTHTGHGVLIGSFAALPGTSLYRSSTALWVVAMVLFAWSAAVVLGRGKSPVILILLAAVGPLLIGPITTPPLVLLSNPSLALQQDPLVSARMYWNLPQALSIAVTAVAVVCFDGYCRAHRDGALRWRWLLAAAAAIVASGWIKPSLFVFYGPALLLTLLIYRARIAEMAMAAIVLAAGVAVYLLPSWLVDVGDHPGWSLHPGVEQTQHVLAFVFLGCGAALLFSLRPLRELFAHLAKKHDPRPISLALIAMGGSLLFALLFREDRFTNLEGFPVFQPNLWWGPSACVVLLMPLLLQSTFAQIAAAEKANWAVICGLILLSLQIISGSLFALAYPVIFVRGYSQEFLVALATAREKTPPETRFLLDPNWGNQGFTDVVGMLARPCLFDTFYLAPSEQAILRTWFQLFDAPYKSDDDGWADYDAAVISERDETKAARDALRDRGWTSQPLSKGFQLWTSARRASQRGAANTTHHQFNAARAGGGR